MNKKRNFAELSIEDQFKEAFGNYERAIQEKVLFDVLTGFYFADWTRKCDYENMTSEEVVDAAMSVCKKLEEKYDYSLNDEFWDIGPRDWGDVDL